MSTNVAIFNTILKLTACILFLNVENGLEETIIQKKIEQNQLTWYDNVQRMAEGRLPKIALKWIPKQREYEEDRRKTGWRV